MSCDLFDARRLTNSQRQRRKVHNTDIYPTDMNPNLVAHVDECTTRVCAPADTNCVVQLLTILQRQILLQDLWLRTQVSR